MTALYTRPGQLEFTVNSEGKNEAEYLNERAFNITVTPTDELVQLFNKHDITRRGKYAWAISDTNEGHRRFLAFYKEYQAVMTPNTLHSGEGKNYLEHMTYKNDSFFTQPLALTAATLNRNIWGDPYYQAPQNRRWKPIINIKDSVRNFFGRGNNIYDIPEETLLAADIHPDYHDMLVRADQSVLGVFRENFSPFVLVLELKHGTLWFRLKFVNFDSVENSMWNIGRGGINGLTYNTGLETIDEQISGLHYMGSRVPTTENLFLNDAMRAATNLEAKYNGLFTPTSIELIQSLRETAKKTIFVSNSFSNPNKADVMNASSKNKKLYLNGRNSRTIESYAMRTFSVSEALELQSDDVDLLVHPALYDLQSMIQAEEYMGDERLYGYQRRAVGLQLSTNRGFVNSLDTGIGKSVVQLTAMRERSRQIENYRGLIACQSNTIKQWYEYMVDDEWFPEATIAVVNSSKKLDELINALAVEGPVVVLITFNMLAQITDVLDSRNEIQDALQNLTGSALTEYLLAAQEENLTNDYNIGEILVDAVWNDVCADEATAIRNDFSSKQSRALWQIRSNSEVGTALTATPFNKSITDIERLLAWVRNDRRLFHGSSLASQYDQENLTEEDAKRIFDTLYPMVLRFTKEEAVAEEKDKISIPTELEPETLLLKPTPAEMALSQACEFELKRIIDELEEALNNVEAKTDSEKEELAAAREELRNAHGHWLSGTNIARMATSNPASILKSNSVAAQLLVSQGLVAEAMKDVPTKQRVLLPKVVKNVEEGKQVLVFTDFVDVADALCDAFETIGVRAGVFAGKNLKKRDENRVAFQAGELDVLICTKAAERGLTLHRAAVTYHYDISWTLEPLLQKAGRAARVGSENESVETYFLVLEGTIEEKVVKQVFTQGTLSSMVLDKSRGVDIKNTTTGKLMGGLMKASTNLNTRKGALEFGKALLG